MLVANERVSRLQLCILAFNPAHIITPGCLIVHICHKPGVNRKEKAQSKNLPAGRRG